MSLPQKLYDSREARMPAAVINTLEQAANLLVAIHRLVDGKELDDTTAIVASLIELLDAADLPVANPPGKFVKVRVYESTRVEFVVEVPAGLVGEELEAAIEEARVQAGPKVERTESVLAIDWDLE